MIGIFDSGLGGLTALKEIRRLMPEQELIYFGDTGRVPYGPRSGETISKYAMQDMRFLTSFPVDAVVVACGTVSTTALPLLRKSFGIPIIGVVEGAAEAAARATKNGRIAVIGTAATIRTGAFPQAILKLLPDAEVSSKACPLFVPLVESGFVDQDDEVTLLVCRRYLESIRKTGCDTLILGCTHYPIIAPAIAKVLPGVTLINTGLEAARKLASLPGIMHAERSGIAPAPVRYYVSDDPDMFINTASVFLGGTLNGTVDKIEIDRY